jgi:hypothetical protein
MEDAQPVWRACLVCGIAVKADPIDLAYEDDEEDAAEYICVACAEYAFPLLWND